MNAPVWLLRSVIDAVQDAQLAEHGGAEGLRDEGALDSALARPINLHAYGETDLFRLAAAYAFGIGRNYTARYPSGALGNAQSRPITNAMWISRLRTAPQSIELRALPSTPRSIKVRSVLTLDNCLMRLIHDL